MINDSVINIYIERENLGDRLILSILISDDAFVCIEHVYMAHLGAAASMQAGSVK